MPSGQYRHKYIPGQTAWKRLYASHHYQAKSGGVLTLERFKLIVAQPCHYCGAPPPQVNPYGSSWPNSNRWLTEHFWQDCWIEAHGIDKVVPTEDYSDLANLVPCCKTCNWLKGTLQQDKFLTHIEKIYEHQHPLMGLSDNGSQPGSQT